MTMNENEPVVWVRRHPDGALTVEFLEDAVIEPVRKKSGAWVPLYTHPAQPVQPAAEVVRVLVEALQEIEVSAEDCADGKYPWPHHQNYKDFAEHAKAALTKAKGHGL